MFKSTKENYNQNVFFILFGFQVSFYSFRHACDLWVNACLLDREKMSSCRSKSVVVHSFVRFSFLGEI